MRITVLVYKLFVLILASPSHELPIFGNPQHDKYNRRNPSFSPLSTDQLDEDAGADGDLGGWNPTGDTGYPSGSPPGSLTDSLIAESPEQQNQPSNQKQPLWDSTTQKSPTTPNSSQNHRHPPSSTNVFDPWPVDFHKPVEEQLKEQQARYRKALIPTGYWAVDPQTPFVQQLKEIYNNFWLKNHQNDGVVKVDRDTPSEIQILQNTNRQFSQLGNIPYLPDVDIVDQVNDNFIRNQNRVKPDVKSVPPDPSNANGPDSDQTKANPVDPSIPLTPEQCPQKTNPEIENHPGCQ